MNKRWVWITLGALAILGALGVGTAAGAALILLGRDVRPARAALPVFQAEEGDSGVLVSHVEAESPAAQVGVKRGDILVELDGQALSRSADLFSGLAEKQPGDLIELIALHGDERRKFSITLGERNGNAYLGVRPCWDGELSARLEVEIQPGALIGEVTPGGPADQASLKEGDVILSVDGRQPGTDADLGEIIRGYNPGDTVTLEVRRAGESEPTNIAVTLGENPDEAGVPYLGVSYTPVRGILHKDGEEMPLNPFGGFWDDNFPAIPGLPPDGQFFERRLPALPEGVEQAILVGSLAEGSPAEQAGLQTGDLITAIDGEAVGSPKQTVEQIRSRKPGDQVSLTVYRQDTEEPMTIEVTLGEDPEQAGQAYLGMTISGYMKIEIREGEPSEPDSGLPFFRDEPFFPDLPEIPSEEIAPSLDI